MELDEGFARFQLGSFPAPAHTSRALVCGTHLRPMQCGFATWETGMDTITVDVDEELGEELICDDELSEPEWVELPMTELEEVAGGQSSAVILD